MAAVNFNLHGGLRDGCGLKDGRRHGRGGCILTEIGEKRLLLPRLGYGLIILIVSINNVELAGCGDRENTRCGLIALSLLLAIATSVAASAPATTATTAAGTAFLIEIALACGLGLAFLIFLIAIGMIRIGLGGLSFLLRAAGAVVSFATRAATAAAAALAPGLVIILVFDGGSIGGFFGFLGLHLLNGRFLIIKGCRGCSVLARIGAGDADCACSGTRPA